MSRRRNGPPAIAVFSLVAVLVLVLGSVLLVLNDGSSSPTPAAGAPTPNVVTASPLPYNAARSWMDGAIVDFNPLKGVLVGFTTSTNDWRSHKVTDAAEAAELQHALPDFVLTRDALAKRTPFATAPRALDDYRQAVTLYLQAGRLALAATGLPNGPLHDQLGLGYARLQNLADRVFDQANVELAPYLPPAVVVDGLVLQKPAEVPDWASLELAAGPPLDSTPTTTSVRKYIKKRPQQSIGSWTAAVEAVKVPGATDLAQAVLQGSTTTLRGLSDAFVAASNAVYRTADPQGERVVSTRVQLSLLADSEAARAAEAATLAPAAVRAQLSTIAQTMALVGDALWDTRLGARDTGFSRQLLTS